VAALQQLAAGPAGLPGTSAGRSLSKHQIGALLPAAGSLQPDRAGLLKASRCLRLWFAPAAACCCRAGANGRRRPPRHAAVMPGIKRSGPVGVTLRQGQQGIGRVANSDTSLTEQPTAGPRHLRASRSAAARQADDAAHRRPSEQQNGKQVLLAASARAPRSPRPFSVAALSPPA